MTLKRIGIASSVLGFVLAGVFTWQIVAMASGSPQDVDSGPVQVRKEGLTVYASAPVSGAACAAKHSTGEKISLVRLSGSETITIDGRRWHSIARSVERIPAGDYTISCETNDPGVTFGALRHTSLLGLALARIGAVGSFLLFVILGAVLLGVARNRRRRPIGSTFPGPRSSSFPGQRPGGRYPPPGNRPPYDPGPNPNDPKN